MKSREYGTWPPRNALGAERQRLYDAYNRSLKKERPEQPNEYASSDVDEYYRVPETKDVSGYTYGQPEKTLPGQSKRKNGAKANKSQFLLRQVVGVLVGSVVIATTYQAMAQHPNWNWSEDNRSVVLEILDGNDDIVKELPVVISVSEIAATCKTEGHKTYTATAEDEDNKYSDTRSEVLPALGHAFDGGTETVLENGQTALTFECTRCHEQFTIATSMTEND